MVLDKKMGGCYFECGNLNFLSRKWLFKTAGVDRAVAYAVPGRIWQIVVGVVNIILIARFITRSEQGYLYTFQSLLAFQLLFDLSLSGILVQFAGHEMAHLKWQAQGTVEGESAAKSRLASLIRISFKWYSIAAVLMLVLLTSGGLGERSGRGIGQQQSFVCFVRSEAST